MTEGDLMAAVVDIETTGLSAIDDIPLEVGVRLIDREGFPRGEISFLIWESTGEWSQKIDTRGMTNPIVGPMHEKSGLWRDLQMLPAYTRKEADDRLCEFLTEHEVRFGTLPMMGNSTGSLDRPFVLVHFPDFNRALSYRNIDISSVRLLCAANNPELNLNIRSTLADSDDAPHRVMGDIDACIEEYRAYRENFFYL